VGDLSPRELADLTTIVGGVLGVIGFLWVIINGR
jgi:hypothetical protein